MPRHFLPDGSECDEEGYPIVPMTLPPDGSPPLTSNPPGGVDIRTGKMSQSETLAPLLHWSVPVCANFHPQSLLQYGDRRVPVDKNLAPVIAALWRAGYTTLSACEGGEECQAFVMFSEDVGKAFMQFVRENERRMADGLAGRFYTTLQDRDSWFDYMEENYPLLEPVYPDALGRVYTISWCIDADDLIAHANLLVELLEGTR